MRSGKKLLINVNRSIPFEVVAMPSNILNTMMPAINRKILFSSFPEK
jgi:hypothetical protein